VPTGAINSISVIDIDPRRGGHEWFSENRDRLRTRIHHTRGGGWHLIFNYVAGLPNTADRIAPGVETKNDGKYVVWWPEHGGRVEGSVADCPGWIVEQTNTHMGVAAKPDRNGSTATPMVCFGPPTEYQHNYAIRALRNAGGELWMCREGARNIKLNALAYKMGRLIVCGWIARDRVETFLLRACEANGLLADDGVAQCRSTVASGINAGMQRPYHNIGGADG
jgi:hypothetical protein